jgi:hypothetical protein
MLYLRQYMCNIPNICNRQMMPYQRLQACLRTRMRSIVPSTAHPGHILLLQYSQIPMTTIPSVLNLRSQDSEVIWSANLPKNLPVWMALLQGVLGCRRRIGIYCHKHIAGSTVMTDRKALYGTRFCKCYRYSPPVILCGYQAIYCCIAQGSLWRIRIINIKGMSTCN